LVEEPFVYTLALSAASMPAAHELVVSTQELA